MDTHGSMVKKDDKSILSGMRLPGMINGLSAL